MFNEKNDPCRRCFPKTPRNFGDFFRKKFIERNRIWFLRNLALGTSGREEVLKALNQLSTSKTRTKPGGPQVSPKREVLVQKRVPMKPNYSESTLSINSQTEALQESCSFINLHQRGSPMDLDREREYFYANLPTYSNFSGENEPNPIRSTPHIRELCTARASDSSIRTAVSCADQNQNINSELRKSVCKCCSKTNGVRKHMRRKLSPIQNANKKPRGRRPRNNKRNIAAVRETSLVRKTRSGKVYNSATLSMIGHQNLLQGVQKVQAIPNLQMSGR